MSLTRWSRPRRQSRKRRLTAITWLHVVQAISVPGALQWGRISAGALTSSSFVTGHLD